MKKASETYLKGILAYTEDEVVSHRLHPRPALEHLRRRQGIELNSEFFKLVSWYDNEWGYSQPLRRSRVCMSPAVGPDRRHLAD